MANNRYHQGFFKPKNPQKYKGDPTNIVYRSSWEARVMGMFDTHPEIVEWSSEEIIVPYFDESTQKYRRYFPDFIFKKKNGITVMVEIKPFSQTQQPSKRKNQKTATFLKEVLTYQTNKSKWKYAEEYCKKRGWEFLVVTEKELFGK